MEASQKEKLALADQYKTSIETLEKAYGNMNAKFMARLKAAKAESDKRKAVMRQHFKQALAKEAAILGCDRGCLKKAHDASADFGEAWMACCNDGVIRVDFATV